MSKPTYWEGGFGDADVSSAATLAKALLRARNSESRGMDVGFFSDESLNSGDGSLSLLRRSAVSLRWSNEKSPLIGGSEKGNLPPIGRCAPQEGRVKCGFRGALPP